MDFDEFPPVDWAARSTRPPRAHRPTRALEAEPAPQCLCRRCGVTFIRETTVGRMPKLCPVCCPPERRAAKRLQSRAYYAANRSKWTDGYNRARYA